MSPTDSRLPKAKHLIYYPLTRRCCETVKLQLEGGLPMRLFVAALTAGLLATPVMAADMPVKAPILKAPPMAVYNWTGCYIGAGAGYGMWNQDNFLETDPGGVALSLNSTAGGRGWFGTATLGCDYQISSSFVIGAYGDYDFGDIKGDLAIPDSFHGGMSVGNESEKWAWSIGGRIGYLVSPTFLTYVSGGYTQAHFDSINFTGATFPFAPSLVNIGSHTYNKGWFIGSGFDYSISFLPAGFYLRSEYRYSTYDADDLPLTFVAIGGPTGEVLDAKKRVQTVRTELIYRFNWH
jgi:outer membrane immunogenic protein